MPAFPFYTFAAIMLIFGFMVILSKNPVSSALSLVVSFVGLAALFIGLNAYFIGVVQVLVYAGAVMVLFLFIIMLLDLKAEKAKSLNLIAVGGGVILVIAFVIQLSSVLWNFEPGKQTVQDVPIQFETAKEAKMKVLMDAGLSEDEAKENAVVKDLEEKKLPDVALVGERIFSDYNFHLQVVGVLLLVATLGVIILSKRELT